MKIHFFILAFFLAVGPCNAFGKDFSKGESPGKAFLEALESLGLSQEQKTKIKEIRDKSKDATRELRSKLREARKALEESMKGDTKKEELLSKFDSLETLRNQMARARFEMRLAIREILTPEQRKKSRSFMEDHRGGRHGKGQGEPEED